jgi:hypothetical protein
MVATGSDITITIGGTEYTNDIDRYTETGGEFTYKTVKMSGNNYKKILTGRTDYEVSFNFKVESTTLDTLYENASPITIVIDIGTEQTITYSNMLPKSLITNIVVDNIADANITYHAPAFNGTNYNRQIT